MNDKTGWIFKILVTVMLAFLLVSPIPLSAAVPGLSAVEQDGLTEALTTLSEVPWDRPSIDIANPILLTEYAPEVWSEFFSEFFTSHPLTDSLWDYIIYPTFWWGSPRSMDALQQGLATSMMYSANAFMEEYSVSLPEAISGDSIKFQTLMNTHRFLNELTGGSLYVSKTSSLPSEIRDSVFQFYVDYATKYPQYIKDWNNSPYIAKLKAQVSINLLDAIPQTQATKAQISTVLGLSGTRLDIWNSCSVLIIDNNGLDINQLSVIFSFLQLVLNNLHDLGVITVADFFGSTGNKYGLEGRNVINIFGFPVGEYTENSFPSDVQPGYTDVFSIVVAHEFAHSVDYYQHNNTAGFAERKEQLLNQAGDDSMNYLRSMIESGYFTEFPQEFFASIANEWFTDSWKTIELGIIRFEKGIIAPLNQALFFAEVYSQGNIIYLYRMDTSANLVRSEAELGRDDLGRINSISYMGKAYLFTLDGAGNIINFEQKQCTLTINTSGNGTAVATVAGPYNAGSIVPIIATPATGWKFVNWSGDAVANTTSASTTITMDSNKTVTANFSQISHTLTININGQGSTTPSAGTHTYNEGAEVQISATPASGWVFTGWSGDAVANDTSASTTITMDSNKTVTANFSQISHTLTINKNGQGSTTPSVGTYTYNEGEEVEISAEAAEGWEFTGWSGDASGTGSPTITMDGNKTVTANFSEIPLTTTTTQPPTTTTTQPPITTTTQPPITTTTQPPTITTTTTQIPTQEYKLIINTSGSGEAIGTGFYTAGNKVDIVAVPGSDDWVFDCWTGDIATCANPNAAHTTITIDKDLSLTANFVQRESGDEEQAGSGFPIWIIGVVAGALILSGGGYLLYSKYAKKA